MRPAVHPIDTTGTFMSVTATATNGRPAAADRARKQARKVRRDTRMSYLLLLPYLLWVSFATLLNASIWWLN